VGAFFLLSAQIAGFQGLFLLPRSGPNAGNVVLKSASTPAEAEMSPFWAFFGYAKPKCTYLQRSGWEGRSAASKAENGPEYDQNRQTR
jgi:hypothetical protein